MRRRIGPGLIAVLVLLAAGAGTGAYLLVRQLLPDPRPSTVGNGPSTGAQTSPSAGPASPRGGISPVAETTPATATSTFPPPTADACPAFTTAAVTAAGHPGSLKLLLYVDGALEGTRGAEAWICQDSDGSLYYQGHNKTAPATDATTSNTILLGPGVRGTVEKAGTGYLATLTVSGEGTTRYIVNFEVLSVRLPSGEQQTYTVTRHVPN
jgi:hypothetical protein